MNEDIHKEDIFVKKLVKEASLEQPGDDFMPSLMDKINKLEVENNIANEPIISSKGWFTIGVIIVSIFVALLLSDSSTIGFPDYNFSFDNIVSLYSSVSISKVFLIGLVSFIFFFIVNITITTKKYFATH